MTRLGYKKTRTGCNKCKQRRIKCDEKRPCSACIRHGLECIFMFPATIRTSSVALAPRSVPLSASNSPASSAELQFNFSSPASHDLHDTYFLSDLEPASNVMKLVAADQPTDPRTFWITTLELMHHFTAATYATLPRAVELQKLWQIEVPRLALPNNYLLHQLLATSAHHLAYLNPTRSSHYLIYASSHQEEALSGLQSALKELNEDNCHAIFAAAQLLSICGYATLSRDQNQLDQSVVDDILDVTSVFRGVNTVLYSFAHILENGVLSDQFINKTSNRATPLLTTFIEKLRQLPVSNESDLEIKNICQDSIRRITKWTERAITESEYPELRMTTSWPICLTDSFINLIRQHNPLALSIIAHIGVILNHVGPEFWYMKDKGRQLIAGIAEGMESRWRDTLEWPLSMINQG